MTPFNFSGAMNLLRVHDNCTQAAFAPASLVENLTSLGNYRTFK